MKLPARIVLSAGVVAVVFTGVMGFAHTPAGRPILKFLGMGCPVKARPEQIQAGLQVGVAALRGSEVAPQRPALGLTLDGTTLAEAQRWADGRGLECVVERSGLATLHCQGVPAGALAHESAPADALRLTFSQADRLIAVDLYRGERSSAEAAALFARAREELAAKLGRPTDEQGQASADYLGGGTMHLAQIRYRYRDYLAQVTAANLGARGISERELFQSARF